MKKLLFVVILFCVGAAGLQLTIEAYLSKKIDIQKSRIIEVPKGTNLTRIASRWSEQGIIDYPRIFVKVGQLYGYSSSIKYGEYQINPGDNYRSLLEKLADGDTYKYKVTFVEGDHIFDYARKIAEAGLANQELFLRTVRDRDFIKKLLGENYDSLEGYLFPDTYAFSKADSVQLIISTLVNKFLNETKSISFSSSGLSRHEAITLASIIEKETGAAFERPMISSVFHNRLKKRMRLQTDPTIIYGIMHESGNEITNIRLKDKNRATAYNTYVIKGLPPGPIANPGLESIKAAVKPKNTKFLYFVSQNDGTHVFTETYKDHLQAVKKYQLNRKMREGKSWRDLKQKKVQ